MLYIYIYMHDDDYYYRYYYIILILIYYNYYHYYYYYIILLLLLLLLLYTQRVYIYIMFARIANIFVEVSKVPMDDHSSKTQLVVWCPKPTGDDVVPTRL
jgi:hypothetical protein